MGCLLFIVELRAGFGRNSCVGRHDDENGNWNGKLYERSERKDTQAAKWLVTMVKIFIFHFMLDSEMT